MKAKTIDILKGAMENKTAVGAFNTSNLEVTQAIIRASKKLHHPCIIQTTVSTMNFVGNKTLGDLVNIVIKNESNDCPIGFHLDHGKTLDDVMNAIDLGVDSVMIDASALDFKLNLEITKKVVEYAHSKNVAVQAELGRVPYLGREQTGVNWDDIMTNPEEAKILVEETEVDALAVGIGNAHGFFREKPEPDWERLKKIRELIPHTPLIMHGASDWDEDKIRKAVTMGICCFNIDTDIRIAFMTTICNNLSPHCDITDPRKLMEKIRTNIQEKVEEKIRMFNRD
jgi:fructose-bisphosphate aldolase class II